MQDLEALRRHFVDFGSSLGVIFSILGALGRVSGAIFSQSRILKHFFAKFYRFGEVLARFEEGWWYLWDAFFQNFSNFGKFW